MAVAGPRLMAITGAWCLGETATLRMAEAVCGGARPGTVVLQLREPAMPTRALLDFGRTLAGIAEAQGQWFAVNDRLDVAMLLGATALHLTEASVPTRLARARSVADWAPMWVSRAWHGFTDPDPDADALVVSPVFEPRKGNAPLGEVGLRALLDRIRPDQSLIALGGVTAAKAARCIDLGCSGVAAIGEAHAAPARLIEALGIVR